LQRQDSTAFGGWGKVSNMLRLLRTAVSFVFGAIVVAILASVVGEFFIELARERGLYDHPSQRASAAMSALHGFVTQTAFLMFASAVGGLTLGLWLDRFLGRREKPSEVNADPTPPPDDQNPYGKDAPFFSDYAREEAPDKASYNDLLAFSLDYLIPACEAQLEMQETIIAGGCENERISRMARSELYSEYGPWRYYDRLSEGLTQSPGPVIRFDAMIDCIFEIERHEYRAACEYTNDLALSVGVDQDTNEALTPLREAWRAKHHALINAYDKIKRDSRFEKLLRPARPSRWEDPTLAPETDFPDANRL